MMSVKSFNWLVLGSLTGFCLSLVLAPVGSAAPTSANTEPLPTNANVGVDPLQGLSNPEQNSNPFSRANQGDNFGVMDLLRNATRNNRNPADVSAEQNEDLDAATARFRAKQQQIIRQQSAPAKSVIKLH